MNTNIKQTNRRISTFLITLLIGIYMMPTSQALFSLKQGKDGALPSLAPMLEKVTPAVVNIATEGSVKIQQNPLLSDPFFQRFFNIPNQPLERKTQSLGSGVIVDADKGLVLTNHHVIANASQITVSLRDGRHLEAELIGSDPETDVAVIKISAKALTSLKIADTDKLRVGDFAVAIGNPLGLGQTVTWGIISALGRSGLGIEGYEDFIQTDAHINPGNSGGALVNLKGELIGINTAIISQTGGSIGIGFAIPINVAMRIMQQLLDTGQVSRGYLGVQMQDLTDSLAAEFGLPSQQGVLVAEVVRDSPADKAGFMSGDVIVSVDNKPIKNALALRSKIGLLSINERVTFEIIREKKRKRLTATLSDRVAGRPDVVNTLLKGVVIEEIEPNQPYYNQGVIVTRIEQGSSAWIGGLRQGDVITSVNRRPVPNLDVFLQEVDRKNNRLLFLIIRQGRSAYLTISK